MGPIGHDLKHACGSIAPTHLPLDKLKSGTLLKGEGCLSPPSSHSTSSSSSSPVHQLHGRHRHAAGLRRSQDDGQAVARRAKSRLFFFFPFLLSFPLLVRHEWRKRDAVGMRAGQKLCGGRREWDRRRRRRHMDPKKCVGREAGCCKYSGINGTEMYLDRDKRERERRRRERESSCCFVYRNPRKHFKASLSCEGKLIWSICLIKHAENALMPSSFCTFLQQRWPVDLTAVFNC